jgi:hypothetical protein
MPQRRLRTAMLESSDRRELQITSQQTRVSQRSDSSRQLISPIIDEESLGHVADPNCSSFRFGSIAAMRSKSRSLWSSGIPERIA